jgi:glycosyltransferase involved in cell wall biosynthesis
MRCPSLFELPAPPTGCTGWPWTAEGQQLPEVMPDGSPWPYISLVTPSYNQDAYLEATIRSILLQGYPNLEYIIIDGGSTDGSPDIIRKYEPWLSYWETGPDDGQYSAIQKGFQLSTGKIMAWLNSDDLYFPWALHTVAEIFSTFPHIKWLSTTSLCTMGSSGSPFNISRVPEYSRRAYFSQDLIKNPITIQQESTFWKRDLWDQSGAQFNNDLNYAGDFELWTRFWQFEELATTSLPLGMFRYHKNQKTINIAAYFDEARIVLDHYRRPLPFPVIFLYPLLYLLKRCNSSINWLGARKWRLLLKTRTNQWTEDFFYW